MTKVLEIEIHVVFTPWSEITNEKSTLRTKENLIETTMLNLSERLKKELPEDCAHSLIIGHRLIDNVFYT